MSIESTLNFDERGGLPSASGAPRWMQCPASIAREAAEPRDETRSADAAFGARIHAALAGAISENELTPAETETFQKFAPLWREFAAQHGISRPLILCAEERLWLHDDDLNPIMSGQPDLALRHGDSVFIVEFKTLRAPDPAHINWQLRAQAVLLRENHSADLAGVRDWHLVILQPNASPPISHAAFSSHDVDIWSATITNALRSNSDDSTAIPGRWCQYCRARKTCREFGAFAAVALADAIPVIENSDVKIERAITAWRAMPPAQRLARFKLVKLAAELEAEMKRAIESELAENPDAYGGAAFLRPGADVRKITRVQDAVEALVRAGVSVDDLLRGGAIQIAIGALDVAYANARQRAAGERETKTCPQKYRAELAGILGELIEVEQRKPSLVLK